jgi:Zn-dependent M28 family amino/carboxypeptidase
MKSIGRRTLHRRGLLSARLSTLLAAILPTVLFATLLSSAAFAWQGAAATATKQAATASKPASTLTEAERKATGRIKLESIREITTKLSSKEFEGRGTGQPGADKAAAYLADIFKKFGLKPAGENGTYLQQIKFRSAEILPETSIKVGEVQLKHREDYVVLPPYTSETVDVSGGLVFVGYGVVSADLKRDDLASLDLKGKTVVMIGGAPDGVDMAAWRTATSPQVRTRSFLERGAAAIIIANAASPQQPFATVANYLSRRRVSLASTPLPPTKAPPAILVSDGAMEKMFAGGQSTYAQTLAKAKTGENVSQDLNKTTTVALRFKISETTSANVVGVLEGSDAKLKEEAVVYSAHYDAYGIDGSGQIFPGAADNALGTATIAAIAEAFGKTSPRPKRSIIFLAVTGEEYGLLGAEYWVKQPTWPLEKVAANLNYDGIGTETYGPVKRVVGFGAEHSELGTTFEQVAAAIGTEVAPDPMPEENAFVRSDHYSFVKAGVPALMLMGAPEGDVAVWLKRARQWLDTDYHSPSDTVKPDWNWNGPLKVAELGLVVGLRVADAEAMPSWLPTSRFNKPRTGK